MTTGTFKTLATLLGAYLLASATTAPASAQKLTNPSPAGERLFLANCAECHQPDGAGIPSIYPALAGNETVTGSAIDVALVLRIGRGEMPSFRESLSSGDMAAIINYIRNAWGNEGAPIAPSTIENLQ